MFDLPLEPLTLPLSFLGLWRLDNLDCLLEDFEFFESDVLEDFDSNVALEFFE